MALDTFIWIPSYTTQVNWQPKLLTTDFTNGYDQELPDGIGYDLLEIGVVFEKITDAEAGQIVQFIRAHGGYKPFYFRPPPLTLNDQGVLVPNRYDDGTGTMRWKCRSIGDTFEMWNSDSLVLPFKQTYNLS